MQASSEGGIPNNGKVHDVSPHAQIHNPTCIVITTTVCQELES